MISIAMATYNGAKYIREQIDSILSQTIQDFELIICDDCSTDNTLSILSEYSDKDQRIKVYENEKNLGYKRNFENVIRKCKGEFIALADQDDIWYPDHLDLLNKALVGDIQIACGEPQFVDEYNRILPPQFDYLRMNLVPTNIEDIARHIFLGCNTFQGASMLIRRSFFEMALPIPEGVGYHDSWFAALSCFAGGLVFVNKYTMRYRRYSDAVTINSRYMPPFRIFMASILVNHSLQDRLLFVQSIKNRTRSLTPEQKQLLWEFEIFLERRKSFFGRLMNIPYSFRHFKAIYTTDWKDIFN